MTSTTSLGPPPILKATGIGKTFGSIRALHSVTCSVSAGEVLCVLGDNGAGKSTFIKILAGAHEHTEGELFAFGNETRFQGPRQALDIGIATVFQTLATVPLMSVWRNFFLGSEIIAGRGAFRRLDAKAMRAITKYELANMGIDLRDVDQPIGTLSGGGTPVSRYRSRRIFGGQTHHLGRTNCRAGRQASWSSSQVYRAGAGQRPGSHLHLPQPPARIRRRRPIPTPQSGHGPCLCRQERNLPRGDDPIDGRWCRAPGTSP